MFVSANFHYNNMKASVFALLCVAVFASNLRQPQQSFLAPIEGSVEFVLDTVKSQVEVLESYFISQLYPDNADEVMAELEACQDQAFEMIPVAVEGTLGDLEGLVLACAGGNVTEAANKILLDTMVALKGVSSGCPNMTVNIGVDVEQLFATIVVQTLEALQSPQKAQQLLGGLATQAQEQLEQQLQQFLSVLPEQIQQMFGQIAGSVQTATSQYQAQVQQVIGMAEPIIDQVQETVTQIAEQASEVVAQLEAEAQKAGAAVQAQLAGVEQEVAEIGGKLAVAAGVEGETLQKIGVDGKAAMDSIQQVFAAFTAGELTPDELIAALNQHRLVVNDFGVAFVDVASDGAEKATEIASTACGFISPVLSQIQGLFSGPAAGGAEESSQE